MKCVRRFTRYSDIGLDCGLASPMVLAASWRA
jgi:hypothetical protein